MKVDSTLNYKRNYERMMNNYKSGSSEESIKGLGQKPEGETGSEPNTMDLLQGVFNDIVEENEKLKNTIENLKKHYETDLMEWKGKNKSLQDMLDLYIEASK